MHFTKFITPWGCYRYKVSLQGFLASGDAYNQIFDSIIANFRNKVKCVDDTCMWADSIEKAFFEACDGVPLNPKTIYFAQDTVDFAGLTITPTGVKPSDRLWSPSVNFLSPRLLQVHVHGLV